MPRNQMPRNPWERQDYDWSGSDEQHRKQEKHERLIQTLEALKDILEIEYIQKIIITFVALIIAIIIIIVANIFIPQYMLEVFGFLAIVLVFGAIKLYELEDL